jgi:TonB-linked SusC/RagA family outer membrane protein
MFSLLTKHIPVRRLGRALPPLVLLALLPGIHSAKAQAQTETPVLKGITVTGRVKDVTGENLIGVTVRVKDGTVGTVTDAEGKFNIQAPNSQAVLVFSYVGYQPIERAIKGNTLMNITLKGDAQSLEEVVVVGYGEVKRGDLTGSVGSVNVEDLNKAPVKSFDDALAGRVAGVQVASPDGQPGASPNIVIRGGNSITQDNSPLYVIDGFPIEGYNNNSLNPSEIESIQVLKDASATAIYGSRGANGVILITTKRGTEGSPTITYDGYYGVQQSLSRAKLMDPYEFVKLQLEYDPVNAANLYLKNGQTLDSYRNAPSVDWQDELLRIAPMQSHNLALRGGNKGTKYSVSGSILDQKGTIIASGFKRYQGRFTLDQDVNRNLRAGLNANYSNFTSYGTPVAGAGNSDLALLTSLYGYRPITGGNDLNTLLNAEQDAEVTSATNFQWNPRLTAENELRNRINNQLTANAYADYLIGSSLRLRVTGGVNRSVLRYETFNNSSTRTGNLNSVQGFNGVNGSVVFTELNNYVNENTLTYNKLFSGKHRINSVTGFTVQGNRTSNSGGGSVLVPNESLGINGLSDGTPYTITSYQGQNTLMSFLERVNYSYLSRYLVTLSFRADGSSRFAEGNKWGYFPSASVAWHISEENFMKDFKPVSDAKIRASYGVTGNNRVGDYASFSTLSLPVAESYSPGGVFVRGAAPIALGNPNLKWESTAEADLGLDLGFFNQRVVLTVDLYRKKTTDLLLNSQLPPTIGYATAFQNIGAVQNQGVELTLATVNVAQKAFGWTSNFNIAFNQTKVLELSQNQDFLLTTVPWSSASGYGNVPAYIAQLGQPVSQMYGFEWVGNYQLTDFDETSPGSYTLKANVPNNGITRSSIRPGDIKYADLNGDNVVDNSDRKIIGNPNPKFIGGFSNNFTFKGFDLNVFLQFSYGNDILNANRIIFEGGALKPGLNQFASYANRWTPDNPTNDLYRVGGQGPRVYSTRIVEDGSYMRLKTVNLGYTFPAPLARRAHLQSLRVYAAAQNLLTWTNYTGNDPEVSAYGGALTPGFDFSVYPRARTFTLGLNFSL